MHKAVIKNSDWSTVSKGINYQINANWVTIYAMIFDTDLHVSSDTYKCVYICVCVYTAWVSDKPILSDISDNIYILLQDLIYYVLL